MYKGHYVSVIFRLPEPRLTEFAKVGIVKEQVPQASLLPPPVLGPVSYKFHPRTVVIAAAVYDPEKELRLVTLPSGLFAAAIPVVTPEFNNRRLIIGPSDAPLLFGVPVAKHNHS